MKASSTGFLTAVLVAALLAGSGICVALRHSVDERRATDGSAQSANLASGSTETGRARDGVTPGAVRTRLGDRAALQQWLVHLLTSGDPVARNESLLEMIDGLSPADFPVFFEAMKKICKSGSDPMLPLVLAAWAEVDPAAALKEELKDKLYRDSAVLKIWVARDPMRALGWLTENGKPATLVDQALRTLVSEDPAAALAWAKNHDEAIGENDTAHGRLATVLGGMLPKHLKEVIQEFSQLPPETRQSLIAAVSAQIGRLGTGERLQWLESLPPGDLQDDAVAGMVSGMRTLDERLKLLSDYPSALNRAGTAQIYQQWVKQDYEAALESLEKLPLGSNRNAAVAAAVDGLAYNGEPRKALEVMNRNPESVTQMLLIEWMLVATNNQKEWDLALSTIGRVGNQKSREHLYRQVLDWWLRDNSKAARAWLDSSDEVPDAVKAEFEER